MIQRIGYGALAIAVLVLLFVQDVVIAREAVAVAGPFGDLLRRGSLIPLLFVVVLLRASVELSRIMRAKGIRPHSGFANLMILALLLAPWLSAAGWLGSEVASQEGWMWQLSILMAAPLGTGLLIVLRRDPRGSIHNAGATLLIVFYLGFLGSLGLMLRCGRDIPAQEGAWLLLTTLLVTKASDIGAYFVGSTIGRHKLIPSVSPAKSIEGAVGGLVGSALAAAFIALAPTIAGTIGPPDHFLLSIVHDSARSFSIDHTPDGIPPLLRAVLFGLAMSAAGQIGDLFESCLKRDSGVKDSGDLIPRYGGILDLIDSPMFAMPVAWFLLSAVWDVV